MNDIMYKELEYIIYRELSVQSDSSLFYRTMIYNYIVEVNDF